MMLFVFCVASLTCVPVCRTADNRLVLLTLAKAEPEVQWMHMFRGDPDGARCMQALYNLTGTSATALVLSLLHSPLTCYGMSPICTYVIGSSSLSVGGVTGQRVY